MKKWISFVAVVMLAGAVGGCSKTTVEGPGGKKLTVMKPVDQTIQKGETDKVRIQINRDNFKEPVTVKFENLPKGVEVVDADTKIKAEDSSGTFTLKANPEAAVVEKHKVNVTVEGPEGMKATESFQLTIKESSDR